MAMVQAGSGILYPEQLLSEQQVALQEQTLDISRLNLEIAYKDIDKLPNEQYALVRKDGLGTSDSSVVLGVNPYKTRKQLIEEKCRDYLTEEELAVGQETAVKKGVDLEPLIIKKFSIIFNMPTIKPIDMYGHKIYKYLKFNFDGVTGNAEQYIPVEIKVVTTKGERHYTPMKALYRESIGFLGMPTDVSRDNISIEAKAAHYGIPAYYYTQLQQQILGLSAPMGYLCVLLEKTWEVAVFYIPTDTAVQQELIVQGAKIWDIIETKRADI